MPQLILGSTSSTRQKLLSRLPIPFTIEPPNVDETALPNEAAYNTAKRLAVEKAQAVGQRCPDSLIIGCDQLICMGDTVFGKPGNHQQAIQQLTQMSGQQVTSWTALCLLNTKTQHLQISVERYDVHLRRLTPSMIENYLHLEKPYQCAGSIRVEGLGVVLFRRLEGDDFSALIGLPLIRLVEFFENEKIQLV